LLSKLKSTINSVLVLWYGDEVSL